MESSDFFIQVTAGVEIRRVTVGMEGVAVGNCTSLPFPWQQKTLEGVFSTRL
jgi:hypothetical protein